MKSFAAFVLAGLASAELRSDIETYRYIQYLAEYNKTYENQDDFETRFERFIEIDSQIQKHNQDSNNTSSVGHN